MLSPYRVIDCSGRLGWLTGRMFADLGADVIKVEPPGADLSDSAWRATNLNKRLVSLDRTQPAGQDALRRLAAAADFLFETAGPGTADAALFDIEALAAANPKLIHVSITPFGRSGPRATWRASDLELMAAGGAMALAGEPNGAPLRVTSPQSYPWAASQAAVGAMVALTARRQTGRGQHVDVSAQAAVIASIAHAPSSWDLIGVNPTRAGAFMTGRSVHGAQYRVFWPCKDGYLNFIIYGGVAGRRTNEAIVAWMGEAGAALGALKDIDWATFDSTLATQDEVDAMEAPIGKFFMTLTKAEFLQGAFEREMLGYPVNNVADMAQDPQLDARSFWVDMEGAGGTERHCGGFAVVDGARLKITRPVPEEGAHTREVLGEFGFSGAEIDALVSNGTAVAK